MLNKTYFIFNTTNITRSNIFIYFIYIFYLRIE